VVSPWVESLLFWHWRMFVLFWGGFAMQSRQRFVRQPPLPIDDFFYVMVPGFI